MFYSTPKSSFQLTQLDEFVLVVLLVGLNDIENDVVVFVQKHEQNGWPVNLDWRVNAGLI
jgi:hypothetical protein